MRTGLEAGDRHDNHPDDPDHPACVAAPTASAGDWISANRRSTVTLLAAAALLTGLLAIATASSGEAPITPQLLQRAAQAAEADGGGYDYTCQLNGAPRQIICQGQGTSVSFLVSPSGRLQPEPTTGQ